MGRRDDLHVRVVQHGAKDVLGQVVMVERVKLVEDQERGPGLAQAIDDEQSHEGAGAAGAHVCERDGPSVLAHVEDLRPAGIGARLERLGNSVFVQEGLQLAHLVCLEDVPHVLP